MRRNHSTTLCVYSSIPVVRTTNHERINLVTRRQSIQTIRQLSISGSDLRTSSGALMPCQLRPRIHFKQRQFERGVSEEEVRRAVFEGGRWTNSDGKVHGRCGIWEVVFREVPCTVILITVKYAEPKT